MTYPVVAFAIAGAIFAPRPGTTALTMPTAVPAAIPAAVPTAGVIASLTASITSPAFVVMPVTRS